MWHHSLKKLSTLKSFFKSHYIWDKMSTLWKKFSSHDVCTLTFFFIIITLDSLTINHKILSVFNRLRLIQIVFIFLCKHCSKIQCNYQNNIQIDFFKNASASFLLKHHIPNIPVYLSISFFSAVVWATGGGLTDNVWEKPIFLLKIVTDYTKFCLCILLLWSKQFFCSIQLLNKMVLILFI